MDNRANALHDLFSRGSTPPVPQSQQQQQQQYNVGASHPSNVTSPTQIDSLFQNLSPSSDQVHQQQHSSGQVLDAYSNASPTTSSLSLMDEPTTANISASNSTTAERQSALLSLLGGPSSNNTRTAAVAGPQLPQQVPTPPGSSQRSNASPTHNETQGKILLEQLMSGNPPRSNYSDSQRGSLPGAAPSPPYGNTPREGEYRQYNQQHDPAIEIAQRSQPPIQQQQSQAAPLPPPPPPTQQQQQQQRPPSPRKSSMFDFVSPFDALSSSGSIKKKPVPQQPSTFSSGNEDSGSWTAVSTSDPKRQSVDNLLEHLTRQPYEAYVNSGDYSQSEQQQQPRAPPPPIPPKPSVASPRSSPPKTQAVRAVNTNRFVDPPQGPSGNGRRDKESSPGPRGLRNNKGAVGQGKLTNNKNTVSSPSPQAQNIVFDVSQALDDIQAPRDSVKSTAIALVRQDSVFLPGTTIGATHWVAYAMTKGRVRVISRSSGDRTLLQLPAEVFPPSASVSDMAVFGNRLAGVTTDGGFVVWELPETIEDDVPGALLLCVPPSHDSDALQSVRWHPKEPDTLAVASENQIYLIDLANTPALRGQTLAQSDLHHIGQVFSVPSTIVAFDFDVLHYALATISVDSTLTIWNMHDKLPYTTHKIRGEDIPSSLTFVDGGIVVGRKNGTIFQLLSITNKAVLSTIKFINGIQDDPDMFGHVSYDSRIQTLWVANCRRDSMLAFKINLESSVVGGEEAYRGYFEQVVEFAGPKPTIHFVILTADADPNGAEAHAACVAAKVAPGELALVAFSVHSSGVDQILIRKEWFDTALSSAAAKFPPYALPQVPQAVPAESKGPRQITQLPASIAQQQQQQVPARQRTPPSEDVEAELPRDEGRIEAKPKGSKGKNVNFKEKEDNGKDKNAKSGEAPVSESALGQTLTKEIRKMEESLHTRIGRLVGKEMEKQNQRLEEVRATEQVEDFARQEKILKLISTELTRNTTRVVEQAVKSEVQNSVLPSLENITKIEVRAALNEQVGGGMIDYISQNLPVEIEKLILRPDITNHFAHMLSSNLTPLMERHVKDAITKTVMPVYQQQSSNMHQDLMHEVRGDLHKLKTDLTSWQNEALRAQENSIRELERTVRTLSEQVKFLTMNPPGAPSLHHLQQAPQSQNSPSSSHSQPNPHLRQLPPPAPVTSNYPGGHGNFPQQQVAPPVLPPTWFTSGIAAPQASHPATIPQAPQQPPQSERTPPIKPEQWDEIYLGVLHTQDASKLRDLLSHTNPEIIMPLNGQPLVSQAVILTLVHRLSAVVGETPTNDESFKTSLWWLQRAVTILRPEDKLITDFIPRVVPNVQLSLNTTKQRLAILPGGSLTMETARTISDIQENLRRKVMPVS